MLSLIIIIIIIIIIILIIIIIIIISQSVIRVVYQQDDVIHKFVRKSIAQQSVVVRMEPPNGNMCELSTYVCSLLLQHPVFVRHW